MDLCPKEANPPWPDVYTGAPYGTANDNHMGRCTIVRYWGQAPVSAPRKLAPGAKLPGAVMVGFADGHAGSVKLEDLWNYSWHRDWQSPPNVRSKSGSGNLGFSAGPANWSQPFRSE